MATATAWPSATSSPGSPSSALSPPPPGAPPGDPRRPRARRRPRRARPSRRRGGRRRRGAALRADGRCGGGGERYTGKRRFSTRGRSGMPTVSAPSSAPRCTTGMRRRHCSPDGTRNPSRRDAPPLALAPPARGRAAGGKTLSRLTNALTRLGRDREAEEASRESIEVLESLPQARARLGVRGSGLRSDAEPRQCRRRGLGQKAVAAAVAASVRRSRRTG